MLFHVAEVCNLTRSSAPYAGARGARRVCIPLYGLSSWQPSVLQRAQSLLMSLLLSEQHSNELLCGSSRSSFPAKKLGAAERSGYGSVAFQGFSSSLKVVCMQGGCELGAALKVNSAMIFLRLFVFYQCQLYCFSPFSVYILKRSWHLIT